MLEADDALAGTTRPARRLDRAAAAGPPRIGPRAAPEVDPATGRSAWPTSGAAIPGRTSVRFLLTGEPLTVQVGFDALVATDGVVFALEVRDSTATRFCAPTPTSWACAIDVPGRARAWSSSLRLDFPCSTALTYDVIGVLRAARRALRLAEQAGRFEVMNPGRAGRGDLHPREPILHGGSESAAS